MIFSAVIAGFLLGLAGSLHCVGMCGPLSLALPAAHMNRRQRAFSLLAYQIGRTTTYSIFGLILGFAGRALFVSGLQQTFSIVVGAVLLLFGLLYFLYKRRLLSSPKFMGARLQTFIGRTIRRATTAGGYFFAGMANGLLPCGMIYVALAATLSFSTVAESTLFMSGFGVGTVPAMMAAGYAFQFAGPRTRRFFRRLTPVMISCVGILLILRGANVSTGIFESAAHIRPGTPVVCH